MKMICKNCGEPLTYEDIKKSLKRNFCLKCDEIELDDGITTQSKLTKW